MQLDMSISGIWLAVSAGSLSATASVFGKIGGSVQGHSAALTTVYRVACYSTLVTVRPYFISKQQALAAAASASKLLSYSAM